MRQAVQSANRHPMRRHVPVRWCMRSVFFAARHRASSGTKRSATVYKMAAGNMRIGKTIA